MKTKFHIVALLGIATLAAVFAQGPLTPPAGAPAPVMKTLQQIEPRADLQATPPPPGVDTANGNYHFIINQPGSYYLSSNPGVTKTNGIQINAEGVTLELNGFQISRASGTGGHGIEIAATAHRASVRNGSIKGFAIGVQSLFNVDYPRSCAFRDLAVSGCTNYGIVTGKGAALESCRAHNNSGLAGIQVVASTLTNCTASENTATHGIYAGPGSSVINCSASFNTATYGLFAEIGSSLTNCSASYNISEYGLYAKDGCSLINCSAMNNRSAAATSAGIKTSAGCTITHCTANGNQSTASTLTPTTGMGFEVGFGSTMQNCTAFSNQGNGMGAAGSCTVANCTVSNNNAYGIYTGINCALTHCTATGPLSNGIGIRVGDGSRVTGCTASQNKGDGIQLSANCKATENNASNNTGNGIHAFGGLNRIDGNHAIGNTNAGIRSEAGDFTVRNTVNSNAGGDLVPASAAGNSVAPIQQASTATNPWANLQ